MSSANTISVAAPAAMLACVVLAVSCVVSECVTVHRHRKEPDKATFVEELPPLFISCNLTDIVTISAPTKYNDSLYYLYNPSNDVTQLNITPIKLTHEENDEKTTEYANSINLALLQNITIQNVNVGQKINSTTRDAFGVKGNELVIGPVGQEDHGNWVLSIYYKKNGFWVEMFQVITINVVDDSEWAVVYTLDQCGLGPSHTPLNLFADVCSFCHDVFPSPKKYVPIRPTSPVLNEGDTLELSFAYPLSDVQICELILPSDNRPFDRYYREYKRTSLTTCSYELKNLTTQDAGTWTIVGVGNIVYEGRTSLTVNRRDTADLSSKEGKERFTQ